MNGEPPPIAETALDVGPTPTHDWRTMWGALLLMKVLKKRDLASNYTWRHAWRQACFLTPPHDCKRDNGWERKCLLYCRFLPDVPPIYPNEPSITNARRFQSNLITALHQHHQSENQFNYQLKGSILCHASTAESPLSRGPPLSYFWIHPFQIGVTMRWEKHWKENINKVSHLWRAEAAEPWTQGLTV